MKQKTDMQDIRYAVFDADGTLLDSMGIWYSLGDKYLREKGIEPPPGLWDILKTMTLHESAVYFKQYYERPESVETIMEEIMDIVRDFYYYEVPEKPGAAEYIRRLYRQGTHIAVATASERDQIEHALKRLGIWDCLDALYTCTELERSKNGPEFWRIVAERLGTAPEQMYVYEDALHAARTAVEAGCAVTGVYDAYSAQDEQELKRLCGRYIRDYCELWEDEEKPAQVLTIAGSDPSGGAGIQADLKTMSAHGVYGMSAITALTVQNTLGVSRVYETSERTLAEQLEAVFSDIYPDAVKVGMLPSARLVSVTAEILRKYRARHVVIDPVMVSTSGKMLMSEAARDRMVKELFVQAELITPNIPEAEVLSGISIQSREDVVRAAKLIEEHLRDASSDAGIAKSGTAILIKGGHAQGSPDDYLWSGGKLQVFPGARIDNPNTHGTGCILSSAIACRLAKGASLPESVEGAKHYLAELLKRGIRIGHGNGPVIL